MTELPPNDILQHETPSWFKGVRTPIIGGDIVLSPNIQQLENAGLQEGSDFDTLGEIYYHKLPRSYSEDDATDFEDLLRENGLDPTTAIEGRMPITQPISRAEIVLELAPNATTRAVSINFDYVVEKLSGLVTLRTTEKRKGLFRKQHVPITGEDVCREFASPLSHENEGYGQVPAVTLGVIANHPNLQVVCFPRTSELNGSQEGNINKISRSFTDSKNGSVLTVPADNTLDIGHNNTHLTNLKYMYPDRSISRGLEEVTQAQNSTLVSPFELVIAVIDNQAKTLQPSDPLPANPLPIIQAQQQFASRFRT